MSRFADNEEPVLVKTAGIGAIWLQALFLIAAATAVTFPFLIRGLPVGDDTGTHITYQHFFNEEIALGDPYPRWMYGFNGGLGSPIFFAQYPLPYYVAWGIGKITPFHWGIYLETRSLGLGIVLATILAALFTYAWCCGFCDRWSATAAALIYITLPYFLVVDHFMRDAIGEAWAMAFLPLCLLFVDRMRKHKRFAFSGLALAFGGVILAHLFTAVLFSLVLLSYAIFRGGHEWRQLTMKTLGGLAIGSGIAGVYLFPLLIQRQYMHPLGLITARGGNYSPLSQMFSYNPLTYPQASNWHRRGVVAKLLAWPILAFIGVAWYRSRKERPTTIRFLLAAFTMVLLFVGASASFVHYSGEVPGALPLPAKYIEHRAQIFVVTFLTLQAALLCYWLIKEPRRKGTANFLLVMALASYLMTTSWSQLIWNSILFLWNLQFPWRMNAFLAVATAGLCAMAIAELHTRSRAFRWAGGLVALILWCLIALYPLRTLAFYGEPDSRPLLHFEADHVQDGVIAVYSQADPRDAIAVKSPSDWKLHVDIVQGSGTAYLTSISPRQFIFRADCDSACKLQIGQYYYPLWRATTLPGNIDLHLGPGTPGGLMELNLPPGDYLVRVQMPLSWPERTGMWMSFFGLFIVASWEIAQGVRRGTSHTRRIAESPEAA